MIFLITFISVIYIIYGFFAVGIFVSLENYYYEVYNIPIRDNILLLICIFLLGFMSFIALLIISKYIEQIEHYKYTPTLQFKFKRDENDY